MNQNNQNKKKPEIGDLVRLKDGNTSGELVSIDGNKAIIVTNGAMRVKTDYRKLTKVTDAHEMQKSELKGTGIRYERRFVEPRLDIHGMRAEEALKKVNRYLDDAFASSRNEVEIMHGKGAGILKKVVHELLDERDEVKSYRMASLVRGGAGCTIVKL